MKNVSYSDKLLWIGLAAIAAAGCGGSGGASGGSGGGGNTAPESSTKIGSLAITYRGKVNPNVGLSAGPVSVVGLSGAAITSLIVNPTKSNSNSLIAFAQNEQLYTYSPLTQKVQQITSGIGFADSPAFSKTGKLVFTAEDSTLFHNEIWTCYPDGTGLFEVTKNMVDHYTPSWSPDSGRIIFSTASGEVFTVPYNGGAETDLHVQGNNAVFNSAGTKIAYADLATGGIFQANANGSSPTRVSPSTYDASNCQAPNWSADGTYVVYAAGHNVVETKVDPSGFTQVLTSSASNFYSYPVLSPDNLNFIFDQQISSTNYLSMTRNSINAGSYTQTLGVSGATGTASPSGLTWSGFQTGRTFVGANGNLGTTSSGFLWSQYGSGFASLVSFTATTPSTTKIVAETQAGDGNAPVFSVTADKLTALNYTNGYFNSSVTSAPNVPSALVSFDPSTGQVAAMAPFAMTKGEMKPVIRGNTVTFSGAFKAIYNEEGKNLAPNGASSMTIDQNTGKLISAS